MSRKVFKETIAKQSIVSLIEDDDLIRQVEQSREDRERGRIYVKEEGLEYLRTKVKEFEQGYNI
jgi:hypothetical protein